MVVRTFQIGIPGVSTTGEFPSANAGEFTSTTATMILQQTKRPLTVALQSAIFSGPGGNYVRLAPVVPPGVGSAATSFPYVVVGTDEGSVTGSTGVKQAQLVVPDVPTVIPVDAGERLYAGARSGTILATMPGAVMFLSMAAAPAAFDLSGLGDILTRALLHSLPPALKEIFAAVLGRKG